MEVVYEPDIEALFAEDDGWIAALARQVFRAHQGEDSVAEQVTLFYLENYLAKVLHCHLKYRDPEWRVQYGDPQYQAQSRWIDNLDVAQAFPSPGRLELRGFRLVGCRTSSLVLRLLRVRLGPLPRDGRVP